MDSRVGMKILSFNANGLGDYHKRKDVFDFLRKENAHIYFLQETHLRTQDENLVRSMWGFECVINGLCTNSKGVGIFFNNNFPFKIHKTIKGQEGNYIILDIEVKDIRYSLLNIYGPSSKDDAHFFEEVSDRLEVCYPV